MQKYQEANSVRGKDIVNAMDDIDVIDMVSPPLLGKCPCRSEPLTDTGKRIQLLKMLCLTVIPILGLWGFTVNTLTDTINKKTENEKTKKELYLSVELGELIHHLQQERDMSVLYLSALGPETKTFLLTEYILTDKAIYALSDWPSNLDNEKRQEFESKDKLQEYLSRHRQLLSKVKYDINAELEFYTNIIDVVIVWLYKSITRNKFAQVWKTLVAYLKLTSGKQDVGYERAIGTLFYVQGGFQSMDYFEMYNNRINRFKAFYKTAELYSARVDRLYTSGVEGVGTNITGIINKFRYEIQHHMNRTEPDIQKARYWFDNMTLYLDTLLEIQQDLGYEIIENLNIFILDSTADLSVSATFLVVVLLMCPFVVFATESLTSSIQKYALSLVHKTHELIIEKKKTDSLLHQMVPRPVAEKLKKKIQVHAEYFKSVTIFFSDIFGFSRITTECTPIDIVELLNTLYGTIDALLDDYDVYKVETINDCYMVASGLPNRNGNKHVAEVANFALALLKLIIDKQYTISGKRVVKLRIGMNSGTCMAGIVGSILPRYCLFGDTVNTASRMKSYGCPNRIQISPSTNNALVKLGIYVTKKRGTLSIKGKGEMRTFWLLGKTDDDDIIFPDSDSEEEIVNTNNATEDLPGEIIEYTSFKSALPIPLPGRTTKCGIASLEEKSITREEKITARVLPTQVTENKPNLLEPTVKSMPKDDKNVKNTEKSQEKASDSSRTIKSDTPTKFPESSLAAKIELQQILERVESSSPIIVGKTFLPGDSPKKNASGSRNDTPSYSLICEDRPPVAHVRATINSTKSESQSSSSTDNTDKTKPPLQK